LIAINIPAYQLTYFRNGKPELRSNVVVGKVMNQTVIFSAPMRSIVALLEYEEHSRQRNSSRYRKTQIIWKNTIWNGMVMQDKNRDLKTHWD
jgi:hypothetical protein